MAEIHRLQDYPRQLLEGGEGSMMRATWHRDAGFVVLSIWRGDVCVATSRLAPREAARLAGFIAGGLGDMAQESLVVGYPSIQSGSTWKARISGVVTSWRTSVAWSFDRLAQRLRDV